MLAKQHNMSRVWPCKEWKSESPAVPTCFGYGSTSGPPLIFPLFNPPTRTQEYHGISGGLSSWKPSITQKHTPHLLQKSFLLISSSHLRHILPRQGRIIRSLPLPNQTSQVRVATSTDTGKSNRCLEIRGATSANLDGKNWCISHEVGHNGMTMALVGLGDALEAEFLLWNSCGSQKPNIKIIKLASCLWYAVLE